MPVGALRAGLFRSTFDRPGALTIKSVQVAQCGNGYARVGAIPNEPNQQSEQVFLRWTGTGWQIIDYGTGIDCATDANLQAETERACVALGLRAGPAGPAPAVPGTPRYTG